MSKVFEDEFMDVLSGLVSLCLEALEVSNKHADKLFMHGVTGVICSFDAFYEYNRQIVPGYQMFSPKVDIQVAKLGTNDLLKLEKVCNQHNRPVPTEIKMVYYVDSGKLDTRFRYDDVCPVDSDLLPGDLFDAWVEEEKKKLAAR